MDGIGLVKLNYFATGMGLCREQTTLPRKHADKLPDTARIVP